MPEPTTAELQAQINELAEIVKKQAKVISQTGRNVMQFQIDQHKAASSHQTSSIPKGVDLDDFVSNEDIVQLVTELQQQLDLLEQRTTRRIFNSTLISPTDIIAPLCNQFGEDPQQITQETPELRLKFPRTLQEFSEFDMMDVYLLSKFYDLIPEPQEKTNADLDRAIKRAFEKPKDDFEALVSTVNDMNVTEEMAVDDDVVRLLESMPQEEQNMMFDNLARHLGLRMRRTENVW